MGSSFGLLVNLGKCQNWEKKHSYFPIGGPSKTASHYTLQFNNLGSLRFLLYFYLRNNH